MEEVNEVIQEEYETFKKETISRPSIFEGEWQLGLPRQFDAVTIYLNGRIQSDLNWKAARKQAEEAVENGFALMWDLNLGLFKELLQPLANQTQFLSLTLSIEHFLDDIWKDFKYETLGMTLFRGCADFSLEFQWNDAHQHNLKQWLQEKNINPSFASLDVNLLQQHVEGRELIQLFCRDVGMEYIALLASRLPDTLPAYIYLDVTSLGNSLKTEIQLLNPERFDRLNLALKGPELPFNALGWGHPSPCGYVGSSLKELPVVPQVTVGVCIPSINIYEKQPFLELEEAFHQLKKRSIPFKLIPENHLTSMWDELDYMIYSPIGLSLQGKRKLQGFCAAGGTVVTTRNFLGFSYEINLEDWLKKLIDG